MSWVDIVKSLLYDGKLTFGITIWLIMTIMLIIGLLLYLYGKRRVLFGKKRWLRRLITKYSPSVKVKFDIKGDIKDEVVANVVLEALVVGVASFDKDVGIKAEDLNG